MPSSNQPAADLPNPDRSPVPVSLSDHTTLELGGPAPRFRQADTEAEIVEAVTEIDRAGEPLLLIAGGSNLVIADDGVPYPVLKLANKGITVVPDGDDLLVTVAAGEVWDDVVAEFAGQGWSGIETLSGIPGSAGATPIQNVGAYGAEISQVLESVRLLPRHAADPRPIVLPAADLQLGYRHSALRGTDRAVVLSITIRLSRRPAPIRYGELATALGLSPDRAVGSVVPTPQQVREAVLRLRRGKGMVWDRTDPDSRSAGSFFTNPILDATHAAEVDARIRARLGDEVGYPRYPGGGTDVKLSAAWLIDKAGFSKGFALPGRGGARVSGKHTLALTNTGGSTADLLELAHHLSDGVHREFGVRLLPEPILVGVRWT